jgi:hypothetical protein
MSTKATIRIGEGWHLYEDLLEDMLGGNSPTVSLSLRGVDFSAHSSAEGGNLIEVRLPRALAVELGLLASTGASDVG